MPKNEPQACTLHTHAPSQPMPCKNICKSADVRNFTCLKSVQCSQKIYENLWESLGCAKFRMSAHMQNVQCVCRCGYWSFFQKNVEMCAKVWICKITHVRTRARKVCDMRVWLPELIFAKKCVRKCRCAKFCMSTHPYGCKMCATCMLWLLEFFFWQKNCRNVCESADVRNFAHLHTRTRTKCVQGA